MAASLRHLIEVLMYSMFGYSSVALILFRIFERECLDVISLTYLEF